MNDTNTTNIVVPVPQISWLPKLHEVQGVERNDQVFRGIIQDANRYLDFVGQVLRPGRVVFSPETKREQFNPSTRDQDNEGYAPHLRYLAKAVRSDIVSDGKAVNTALATTDSLEQMWHALRKRNRQVTEDYSLFADSRRKAADQIIRLVSGLNVRLDSWNRRFAAPDPPSGPAQVAQTKLLKSAKSDILRALHRTMTRIGRIVDDVYLDAVETAERIKRDKDLPAGASAPFIIDPKTEADLLPLDNDHDYKPNPPLPHVRPGSTVTIDDALTALKAFQRPNSTQDGEYTKFPLSQWTQTLAEAESGFSVQKAATPEAVRSSEQYRRILHNADAWETMANDSLSDAIRRLESYKRFPPDPNASGYRDAGQILENQLDGMDSLIGYLKASTASLKKISSP